MAAESPTIAALVPMRHSSERVPGKNYRMFGDKPLYQHILQTLLDTPEVTTVVVDTDSPVVTEGLHQHFPGVVVLERPEHLRAGEIPMTDVLKHDLSHVEADWYLQTHTTNPLLRSSTISNALKLLLDSQPEHDSLFAVTRLQARLWWNATSAVNHDPNELLRTQDLPPIYLENSNLYVFQRHTLFETGNRIGENPLLLEISPNEAWDIDEEVDFRIAEILYNEGLS